VARLASVLPYPALRCAGPGEPDLPWSWVGVLEGQLAGEDPTRPWRDALGAATQRQYAAPAPVAMPAAFVLQWLLEAAAVPAVYAAWHSAHVIDPRRAGLSLALEPRQQYPVLLQLREAPATPLLLDERLEAAHTAYRSAATELARSYDPGVNLGPRTRLAMVDDVWSMALARVRGLGPPRRRSCCFLYTLPGTHECTGCPRTAAPA
jgi:hypothetical protein